MTKLPYKIMLACFSSSLYLVIALPASAAMNEQADKDMTTSDDYTPIEFNQQKTPLTNLILLAMEHNPILAVATAKVQSAKSNQQQAHSYEKPDVRLKSSLSYAMMKSNSFPRTANQLIGTYPLYQPDISAMNGVATHQLSASEMAYENQRQQLIKDISDAYFAYVAQVADKTFLAKEKESITDILRQLEQRLEVGYQDLNDVAEIQARLDNNLAESLQAEELIAVSEANLEALVGQGISFQKLIGIQGLPPLLAVNNSKEGSWLKWVSHHPKVQQLKQLEQASNQQVMFEEHKEGIKLNAFGAVVYNNSNGNFYDDMQGVRGGLQLEVPLYIGGRTDASVAKARSKTRELQAQQRELKLQLKAKARANNLVYQSSLKRLVALNQVLDSSKQALRATENGLTTGTRNILDLLNAQRNVHKAERDIPVTEAKIWQNWVGFYWSIGRL